MASFVLSEIITQGILWALYGEFSLVAFIIAGLCSTIIPYVLSKYMLRQQRMIEQQNDQLRDLTQQLRRANTELGDRNAQLNAFTHTVAHDLQTPLNVLQGLSRLLEENYNNVPAKTVKKNLRVLQRTSEKMSRIVDELLALSRMERSEDVPTEVLNMGDIVAEVLDHLHLFVEEYDGKIVVSEEWPDAIGYGPWIEQVWINYISNALKHSGSSPQVELGADVRDAEARFWVRDDGPGLSADEIEQLFVPYQRLGAVRTQGQGLGLSIVRHIIERLGGRVGVESEGKNQGSTFYFTLPLAPRRSPQKPGPMFSGTVSPNSGAARRATDRAVQ